uniref:UDP-glucuronosyltransferase n=1 Tax=Meloidogyne javanica TaxID=6303 RepID=A0A915MRP2_MELJA
MPIFRLLLIILFLLISTFASQQNFNNSKQTKRQLKILVYSPTLSWSHAQFLGKIADTLVDAGHEVDVGYIVDPCLLIDNPAYDLLIERGKTIKERKLLQKLEKEHFDVGIGENYDHCAAAIFHKIGVRVQVTAYAVQLLHWIARKYDIPTFASYVPNNFAPTLRLESFSNRLINFYNEFYEWIWMHDHFKRLQDPIIRAEFGEDFPDLNELLKKSSLVFVNTNPFIDFPRPISNKIVYIGGLVQESAPPDSKILDKVAKEGAILFSFGSITDTTKISNYMRNSILNAFKRFPNVHFIWKLDKETIKNQSELFKSFTNVHAFEWIRQTAILAHPNLRAFISHCGQNSLTESVIAGVPVIGLPLFADQFYNADVAQKLGFGLQIDVNDLNGPNSESILAETIEKVERLVKWVEFAAEFSDLSELDLPGAKEMNWVVYYSIDHGTKFQIIVKDVT